MSSSVETPWHAAFPAPKNTTPDAVSPTQLLDLLSNGNERVVLVDLRRNDHEGGTIQGSINLPAQSLYPSIPSLYSLFIASGVAKVIWYCSSSKGRGNRAAGWFRDYLEDQKNSDMESLVLTGGIKGWVATGDSFRDRMVDFDPAKW